MSSFCLKQRCINSSHLTLNLFLQIHFSKVSLVSNPNSSLELIGHIGLMLIDLKNVRLTRSKVDKKIIKHSKTSKPSPAIQNEIEAFSHYINSPVRYYKTKIKVSNNS